MYALILVTCSTLGGLTQCDDYWVDVFHSSYAQQNYVDCRDQLIERKDELLALPLATEVNCEPVREDDVP